MGDHPLAADGWKLAGFINRDRNSYKLAQIMSGGHKVTGFRGDLAALESLRFAHWSCLRVMMQPTAKPAKNC
jgi:hypothetical protein